MTISTVEMDVPSAQAVRITADTLAVNLSDGRSISAPLAWFPRLVHATEAERSRWRLVGQGHGIHWDDLDEDISVEGLLAGRRSAESPASLAKWLKRREGGKDAVSAIRRIQSLPVGWDGRGSLPPSPEVLTLVLASLRQADIETFPAPNVVPVSGGGVQVEWSLPERELEVEFKPDGSAEYLKTTVASGESSQGAFQASDFHMFRDLVKWLESG